MLIHSTRSRGETTSKTVTLSKVRSRQFFSLVILPISANFCANFYANFCVEPFCNSASPFYNCHLTPNIKFLDRVRNLLQSYIKYFFQSNFISLNSHSIWTIFDWAICSACGTYFIHMYLVGVKNNISLFVCDIKMQNYVPFQIANANFEHCGICPIS